MDLEEIIPEQEIIVTIDLIEKRRFNTLMLSGITLTIVLYPFLSSVLLSAITDYGWRIFLSRIIIWAVMGVMFMYARKGEIQNMLLWPEENYKASFYIKWVFLLYLLTLAAGAVARIPFWLGYHENNAVIIKLELVIQKSPALLVFTAITAGITEEFLFRGYIMSRLAVLINNKHLVVILSALLFALVHLGYKTYTELIFAFGIGIVLGYHYQKYRSLTTVIVVHFLIDVIAMSIGKHH
jgi:membrane protease YdiL (CAAX protease family)